MSENSTPEQRTEMPTGRRMNDLRKKGMIYYSPEVAMVISLIAGFCTFGLLWEGFYNALSQVFRASFTYIGLKPEPSPAFIEHIFFEFSRYLIVPMGILILACAFFGSMAILLQTDFNMKEHKIEFKWNLINPTAGFARIFSPQNYLQTLKSILKLAIILPIGYFALRAEESKLVQMVHLSIPEIMRFAAIEMISLFWQIMYILVPIAIIDWVVGKYLWLRQNKMTKDEVKDEQKSIEGDETTKKQIIAKGLRRIMQRIMTTVPKADVVITNPTHYAIALQYDRKTMRAPKVVAKGKNFLAERIKEVAREHKVPVLERKSLARALYASVEVDQEIPSELFKATAEVLAYVYRVNRQYQPKKAA